MNMNSSNFSGNRLIDLHTHTTASDGNLTPSENVRLAVSKGLAAMAITDHDTLAGVAEALRAAQGTGLEVIPGVEISVDYEPEMHMLGYFLGGDYLRMERVLSELKENRDERNPRIIKKLNEMGMDISMEEVRSVAKGDIIGRPHIARALVDKGYAGTTVEAFNKYLGDGKPAFFKKAKLTPKQGIREILNAGGLPVLAHPVLLGKSEAELDLLLKDLKNDGLMGIEAYYSENSEDQTEELLRLAEKHGLLATVGSDWHGNYEYNIEIGKGKGNLAVGYEVLEAMKAWI